MPINRYYQSTPYQSELYAPPVQFIGAALEQAQKQYDVNFAAAQGLKNKYIQARPQDRARANQIQAEFESKIDGAVAKYHGDYSQASKDLYSLQSEMAKMYGPGGEAGTIQQNLATVQDSLKRERERLAKGEIDSNQMSKLSDYYDSQPATTFNKDTGVYSQVQPLDLAKTVDINKEFTEVLNGVKPRTIERSFRTGKIINGEVESITQKVQSIDPKEVGDAFEAKMRSDIGVSNYISQLAQLSGKDPKTLMDNLINEYKTNVIPARTGTLEDSQKLDYKTDWKTKEDYEFRHKLIAMDHQLANSKSDQIPLTQTVGTNAAAFHPDPLTRILLGTGKEVPTSVDQLLKERNNPNFNYDRLKSIKDANSGKPDSDIIRLYNDAVSKESGYREYSQISYDKYDATSTQQEEANRLMPGLLQGTEQIYKKDGKTGKIVEVTSTEDKINLGKQFADPKNPLKSRFGALGKARGDTGHVPSASTILPDPYQKGIGDIYFIAPNRTDLRNFQQDVLDKAFKFIQDPKASESSAFPVGPSKYAKGKKVYDENGIMNIVYYPTSKKADGTELTDYKDPYITTDPVTGVKRFTTPAEMEKKLLPWETVKGTYAHKTKKDYDNELLLTD